jgi:hypothetical protein
MNSKSTQPSHRNTRGKERLRELMSLVSARPFDSKQVRVRLAKLLSTVLAFHSLFALIVVSRFSAAQSITQASNAVFSKIRDVVYEPGGRPFSGTISLRPEQFGVSTPPLVVIPVDDGLLSVMLVPTTPNSQLASYAVTYSAKDSPTSWVERWRVPQSDHLSLRDVRIPPLEGTTALAERKGSDIDRDVTLPLTISDVSGLNAALNTIRSSLTSLANSESAMITAVGSAANTKFVRGEVPTGVLNGVNAIFTLANSPVANTVSLSLNGVRLTANLDYSTSGNTITFYSNDIPQPGDIPQADYEAAASPSSASRKFDPRSLTLPIPISGVSGLANALNQISGSLSSLSQELASITTAIAAITCPTLTVGQMLMGSLDGQNPTFTINSGTVVGATVSVYYNGVRQMSGVDYTLSGSSIQFLSVAIPQVGDLLVVDYCSN